MSDRKIVQIAVTQDENDVPDIYALAEDGTLWNGTWKGGLVEWRRLPPLPTGELPQFTVINYADNFISTPADAPGAGGA